MKQGTKSKIEKMRERFRRGAVPLNGKELSILQSHGFQLGANAAEFAARVINATERLRAETPQKATDSDNEGEHGTSEKLGEDTKADASAIEARRLADAVESEKSLILELAFAIEDPCGIEAIKLARALIRFGRALPEGKRSEVAVHFNQCAINLEELKG